MKGQLAQITEILKNKPYGQCSYEEFAEYLHENGVRVLPIKGKAYIACFADNIGTDVRATKAFESEADAYKAMLDEYNDILDTYDEDRVCEKSITRQGFAITMANDDLFYGCVVEIETEVK